MLDYEIVDVFTDQPFAGNPLAVVFGTAGLSTGQLQALAREFHLSETAFPDVGGSDDWDYAVRIFTPEVELPFAGHPSVGTAWVLVRHGLLAPGPARQSCGAGVVPIEVEPCSARVTLTGGAPTLGELIDPAVVTAAVGLTVDDLAGPPPRRAGTGLEFVHLLVTPDAVARARPDLRALGALGGPGVEVAAVADGRAHVRMLAGEIGVTEDPATGSAALGLGVYLVDCGLLPRSGRSTLTVSQGAEIARPSTLYLTVEAADGACVRASVAGDVVQVASGRIAVPAA